MTSHNKYESTFPASFTKLIVIVYMRYILLRSLDTILKTHVHQLKVFQSSLFYPYFENKY